MGVPYKSEASQMSTVCFRMNVFCKPPHHLGHLFFNVCLCFLCVCVSVPKASGRLLVVLKKQTNKKQTFEVEDHQSKLIRCVKYLISDFLFRDFVFFLTHICDDLFIIIPFTLLHFPFMNTLTFIHPNSI